jgi:hypothetical protein
VERSEEGPSISRGVGRMVLACSGVALHMLAYFELAGWL